ncbi:unnamed protein product [Polarella glacialis]|nr:unnamed protein product [Polarella glacialis]
MRDPVATADGFIYEREGIELWIRERRQGRQAVISPSTGLELASQHLMPVNALKKAIETYVANRPELCSFFGQRRSVQQAAQLLQEELLEKQVRHNSIEDELDRLQKQMKDKYCHIIEVGVLNQSLSEELERVRAELAERDARDRLLRKEVDEMRQTHQSSQQEVSELRSQLVQCQRLDQEFERVRAELIERDERDNLLRREVDELRQQQKCSQQEVSELRSQLTSAETSCKQLLSELALAQDAASSLKGQLSSISSVVAAALAVSDDPSALPLEAEGSARAPSRALEEINEEGGDDSNRVLSNHTAQADTPEQTQHEQQQQEAAASQNGQSAFTSCPSEVGLLSETSQILAGFRFGQYSVINNLWSRPELTCRVGRLVEFDKSLGRWRLLLENGEYIRVKPECMTHYDVPRGVRRQLFQLPRHFSASETSRFKISSILITFPPLCDAEGLAEHIGHLGYEVFGNGAAQRELERKGGLVSLVNSLGSASNTVQELAAVALGFVGRDLIIDSGAVPRLVALLFGSSCSKVQKEAAGTLARFCENAPDRRQHVFEEIDLHKLALLLSPGGAKSQSVQSGAALLCGELVGGSQGCPPIRAALVKAGVVPHIVALLQLSPGTARHAAFALGCLLFPACEDIRRSIVEANAIPFLVDLLQSEFFHARHMALRAIWCLALDSPSNKLAIATAGTGALTDMAKLMRTHGGAADVLFQVLGKTADVRDMALDPGLLQSTMCCVGDNSVAGYYMKGLTPPECPSLVYIFQVLMVRAQVSEQSAAIQLAINILRSGGLESKTLVCNMFLKLLAIDVSSKLDFKGQITRAGAGPCLQRMLVQDKLPTTSVAARLVQLVLTHLDRSPESV